MRAAVSLACLAAALAATACDRPTSTSTSTSTPTAPAYPVVVALVIDQEAAWIAAERWPLLPADGGLARLLREGTYVRDLRYAHSATDTAPGHSALYTGAPPRTSGIWGNEVLDPVAHTKVSILRDDETKLVWTGAPPAWVGSSTKVLQVDTVADRFRAAHPDAFIVSISIKDRGAIFAGGRKPTASLWWDKELDQFVTSTAFAPSFPAWADAQAVPGAVRAKPWTLLDADWVKAHAATPDDQLGEGELGGMPITFPHDVAHAPSPTSAFRGSPFADDAVLGLGLAALDAEHAGERPTLLALSLSGNDYVGHAYGPDSWEAWDELRRLDASLGRFFAALDTRYGSSGWSAVLSGDHGVTTMPEVANGIPAARPWCRPDAGPDPWGRACGNAGRLMPDELGAELRAVAAKAVPGEHAALVMGVIDPYVYFTPEGRALAGAPAAALRKALTAAILAHPEVARVIDTRALPASCPPESDESIDALVCRAFVPGRSGDLYVLTRPGSFFDPDVVPGKGTSHGTPYLFDRAVPLVARAPGKVPAGRVVREPMSFRAFARTLSSLLGVEPPDPEAANASDLTRLH